MRIVFASAWTLLVVLSSIVMVMGSGGCTNVPATDDATTRSTQRRLVIELLALDLATCGRCTGTEAGLDAAARSIAPALRDAGVELDVRTTVVQTAEEAESLRFAVSPTIRVNGRDVPVMLRESACGDCASICGSAGGVDCRVWVWRNKEYTEAPKALLVDAILRAYASAWDEPSPPTEPFVLPENLKRFFAAKTATTSTSETIR